MSTCIILIIAVPTAKLTFLDIKKKKRKRKEKKQKDLTISI